MLTEELRAAAQGFRFPGYLTDAEEIGAGHVNRTWLLTFAQPQGRYILQKLSAQAFHHPEQVMENASRVCQHIESYLAAMGVPAEGRVLRFVPVLDGGLLFRDGEGGSWRAYRYIEGLCFLQADGLNRLREMGRAFGQFQRLLRDFPAGELYETIPFFHHTPRRFQTFSDSVRRDAAGRAKRRASGDRNSSSPAKDGPGRRRAPVWKAAELPVRAVHNDAKVSNVLFDAADGSALLLLDLDTVMPGSALYDFGDIVRTGASTAAEDEPRGMSLESRALPRSRRRAICGRPAIRSPRRRSAFCPSARASSPARSPCASSPTIWTGTSISASPILSTTSPAPARR